MLEKLFALFNVIVFLTFIIGILSGALDLISIMVGIIVIGITLIGTTLFGAIIVGIITCLTTPFRR